jgi:hypothetical protein
VYANNLHERRFGSHVDAENLRKLLIGLRHGMGDEYGLMIGQVNFVPLFST